MTCIVFSDETKHKLYQVIGIEEAEGLVVLVRVGGAVDDAEILVEDDADDAARQVQVRLEPIASVKDTSDRPEASAPEKQAKLFL